MKILVFQLKMVQVLTKKNNCTIINVIIDYIIMLLILLHADYIDTVLFSRDIDDTFCSLAIDR